MTDVTDHFTEIARQAADLETLVKRTAKRLREIWPEKFIPAFKIEAVHAGRTIVTVPGFTRPEDHSAHQRAALQALRAEVEAAVATAAFVGDAGLVRMGAIERIEIEPASSAGDPHIVFAGHRIPFKRSQMGAVFRRAGEVAALALQQPERDDEWGGEGLPKWTIFYTADGDNGHAGPSAASGFEATRTALFGPAARAVILGGAPLRLSRVRREVDCGPDILARLLASEHPVDRFIVRAMAFDSGVAKSGLRPEDARDGRIDEISRQHRSGHTLDVFVECAEGRAPDEDLLRHHVLAYLSAFCPRWVGAAVIPEGPSAGASAHHVTIMAPGSGTDRTLRALIAENPMPRHRLHVIRRDAGQDAPTRGD